MTPMSSRKITETEIREAWAEFALDWPPDWYRCVLCGKAFPREILSPCHIVTRGAHPELKYEPKNIPPACYECHRPFEHSTRAEKDAWIERVLPGRIELLERLIKERSCKVEVIK